MIITLIDIYLNTRLPYTNL